jgi:Short C-terminal domain
VEGGEVTFGRKKPPMTREERAAKTYAWGTVDAERDRMERMYRRAKQVKVPEPVVRDLGKAIEAIYAGCSSAGLFAAVVRTVSELGYSITSSDSASLIVSFRTGLSWKSWQGQEMTATVSSADARTPAVVLGGKRVTRGYQLQLYDWGEAKSIAHRVIDRLTSIAATPRSQPAAEPRSSSVVVLHADELERLARLHEQGALTDDEFATAKKKLLS